MDSVGERIRQRRTELGLSQADLRCNGVTPAYLSRVEHGDRRPSTRALREIAPLLDVSVYWLETGEDDPSEELARLVLGHADQLPDEAASLALTVLAGVRDQRHRRTDVPVFGCGVRWVR